MSYQNPSKTVKTSQVGSVEHWTRERLAALTIVSAWEIGSRTLRRIWSREAGSRFAGEVGDVTAFLDRGPDEWSRFGLTSTQTAALSRSRTEDARTIAERLDLAGIRFLLPKDDEYPQYLGRTADPPGALFVRGARLVDEVRVAVVGTRKMTDYGKRATELIAGELGQSSITVVSGLALGVDAEAHDACIEAGGRAIAVLPSGVDDASIAPRTNLRLAHRILETGGTLVSEQAPGTPTLPFQFLHRNRLISGLADATVIVEADHDSGSLVTARLALEEGREVLAVPGPIFSPTSRGTNDLIKNGARPCTSATDVLEALGYSNPERAKQISEARALIPVSTDEQTVLDALNEPLGMDDLSRRSGMTVSSVGAIVSMLELKGRIISVGPRTFVRTQ